MKAKVIELLGELTMEEWMSFTNSDKKIPSIKISENRYFHVEKIVDKNTYQPRLSFFIVDKPLDFKEFRWVKEGPPYEDLSRYQTRKVGTLYKEFKNEEEFMYEATTLFQQSTVLMVFSQRIIHEDEELHTQGLLVRELIQKEKE